MRNRPGLAICGVVVGVGAIWAITVGGKWLALSRPLPAAFAAGPAAKAVSPADRLEIPKPAAFAGVRAQPLPLAGDLAGPTGWAMFDGFEHPDWPDPNLWHAVRRQPPAWWPSTCQVRSGLHGFWAFGGPTSRGEVPCAAPVPAGTTSSAYLYLDLRQATAASRLDLFFDVWIAFPPNSASGLFVNLMVPEGESFHRVTVFGATSNAGAWVTPVRRLDLLALTDVANPLDVYDLRGKAWHLEWMALAPNGANAGTGAFIDNLSLVWEPDPAVATPTVRPTLAPTATLTPTATITPSPTSTPGSPALLPLALRGWDLRATPTPEPE